MLFAVQRYGTHEVTYAFFAADQNCIGTLALNSLGHITSDAVNHAPFLPQTLLVHLDLLRYTVVDTGNFARFVLVGAAGRGPKQGRHNQAHHQAKCKTSHGDLAVEGNNKTIMHQSVVISPDSSLDGLLDKRIFVEQPRNGFRIAVDTVLLAAAIPAQTGQNVLDLGCGVGGAMLCLAQRVSDVMGVGLEIQPELVAMAKRNISRNGFTDRLTVRAGDACKLPSDFQGRFDHVTINPPYYDQAAHDPSPNKSKATSHAQDRDALDSWLASVRLALKPEGMVTMIHHADRADEVIALMQQHFPSIERFDILPKAGQPPKRVILRGRMGVPQQVKLGGHLVLHQSNGPYTEEAEAVLRHAQPLVFSYIAEN